MPVCLKDTVIIKNHKPLVVCGRKRKVLNCVVIMSNLKPTSYNFKRKMNYECISEEILYK